MRTREYAHCDMDQRIAVVAFDGDRMVGRNFFCHCPILVNGKLVECVVTYNLFVDPAYRPKGVGTYIKMHVLKLGYPNVSSGVSPEMQKVQDAWSAYRKVASHPVYSVPVDLLGLLRLARMAAERGPPAEGRKTGVMASAVRQARSALSVAAGRWPALRPLAPDEAVRLLDEVLESERLPVQLPWNVEILVAALQGRRSGMRAWLVEFDAGGAGQPRHLVSAYVKSRTIRTLGAARRSASELHLNEIFPPVRDPQRAGALLRFALQQARRCGASILQIYAMTDALRDVCVGHGLETFFSKQVYVAPNSKDKALAGTLGDAGNWWCRAINEDQFEEVGLPRAGLPAAPDAALHLAPRPQ
jgi:hypothetical protein